MKKALIVASIGDFLGFEKNNIRLLQSMGYDVDCAANFDFYENKKIDSLDVGKFNIPFSRNPYSKTNYIAYKMLKEIIDEGDYSLVHSHTPIGGVVARLVCRKKRKGKKIKVIYTAHGFHFFKGAPIINWMIYYPIEKVLSRYTDVLITINTEDYKRALEKFHSKSVVYIPGIGLDLKKFELHGFNRSEYRKSLNLDEDMYMVLSVGELNKNKNHETIIRAIAKTEDLSIHYFIAGSGDLNIYLNKISRELNLEGRIHLLGYRKDIPELCNCADVFALPSLREGLGLSAIEAMASGCPVLASGIHGIKDYSINGKTGYNCAPYDTNSFSDALKVLFSSATLRKNMSQNCKEIAKKFALVNTSSIMKEVYKRLI